MRSELEWSVLDVEEEEWDRHLAAGGGSRCGTGEVGQAQVLAGDRPRHRRAANAGRGQQLHHLA